MYGQIPWQKWSISYLWKRFLVPDHRIPIWLGLIWRLQQWNTNGTHQIHWNSFGFIDILKYPMNHKLQSCDRCTRTEPIPQSTTRSGTSQLWHVYENGADSSNSTNSETWKLWHMYENGADSSNLKESWVHETLIFVTWLKQRSRFFKSNAFWNLKLVTLNEKLAFL